MQIPALIEGVLERMLDVIVVQLPGSMNYLAILSNLCRSQRRSTFTEAVWRNGHNVCCAIGEPDAGARERNLHHVFSKVAGGMHHVLVCRRDTATRRVVVGPEVRGHAATTGRCQQ